MLTSPWAVGPVLLLLTVLGGYAGSRLVRRRRRAVRVTVALVAAIAVGFAATEGWAALAQHRSAVARAMVRFDAGVDDWRYFPAAPVPAGDNAFELRETPTPPGLLDDELLDLLVDTETTSFLVLRGDELLVELYPLGGDRDDVATSFSVAKSLLSTAVGIAEARGELSLDDPVTTYVPELLERDERFGRITLRHLVTMSSGLHYEEDGFPWSDDAVTYYSPDLVATALSAEVEEAPGTRWHYNNYNPLLLGLALERATGRDLPSYLSEHLWQPLGAAYDASWSLDSEEQGFAKMESGFNARPVDYARFGYLFAHEGRVGGRQVVPADWVAEATAADTSTDPAEHYQYFWWVETDRPGRFSARGNKGQFIYVDPATDVVVVRTGRDFGTDDWIDVLADVADRVAPAP